MLSILEIKLRLWIFQVKNHTINIESFQIKWFKGMVSEYIRRSHYNESVSVLSHNYQPGLRDRYRQQHRQQTEHPEV